MADEISKRVKQNFTLIYKSSERMRDSALCSKNSKKVCIYFHFFEQKDIFSKIPIFDFSSFFFTFSARCDAATLRSF